MLTLALWAELRDKRRDLQAKDRDLEAVRQQLACSVNENVGLRRERDAANAALVDAMEHQARMAQDNARLAWEVESYKRWFYGVFDAMSEGGEA